MPRVASATAPLKSSRILFTQAAAAPCQDTLRIDLDRPVKVFHRLVEPLQVGLDDAPVRKGDRVVRLHVDRASEILDRSARVAVLILHYGSRLK